MKTYKVKAILNVTYTIRAEDIEDAQETARANLLDKIDKRDVAYNELKAIVIDGEIDDLHKMYKGKRVAI